MTTSTSKKKLRFPLSLSHLRRDEGDELGYTLLDRLFRVLGDLGVGRQGLLHNARDVGDRQVLVLLLGGALLGRHCCLSFVVAAVAGRKKSSASLGASAQGRV